MKNYGGVIFDKVSSFEWIIILIFVIIMIALIVILKRDILNEKTRTNNKFSVVLVILMLAAFLFFFLYCIVNGVFSTSCASMNNDNLMEINNSNVTKLSRNFSANRVVIIGDSRMSLINDDLDKYEIPINYSFIAESGTKLPWFCEEAMPDLEMILKANKNYIYHVVINMGVNDMSCINSAEDKAIEYLSYYKNLFYKYPNVYFYILSVNPVDERLMNHYWKSMNISNENIEKFNNLLIKRITHLQNNNVYYCDSFNNVEFTTYDGLHYRKATNQKIIDYIVKKCVILK